MISSSLPCLFTRLSIPATLSIPAPLQQGGRTGVPSASGGFPAVPAEIGSGFRASQARGICSSSRKSKMFLSFHFGQLEGPPTKTHLKKRMKPFTLPGKDTAPRSLRLVFPPPKHTSISAEQACLSRRQGC